MGLDMHFFLGPYLECTVRKSSREIDLYGCTTESCPGYGKRSYVPTADKFCASCGVPTGVTKKSVVYGPSVYDVMHDILMQMGDETHGRIFLGPNRRPKKPRKRSFSFTDRDDAIQCDMTELDTSAERAWFEEEYSDAIEMVRKAFDNVHVCWGLHIYYS